MILCNIGMSFAVAVQFMTSRSLQLIQSCLAPHVDAAGFVLVDPADETAGVVQLEYRATTSGRLLVLGLYHVLSERTIAAELWDPDLLTRPLDMLVVDDIALRRRVWDLTGPDLSPDTAREIVDEILSWLDAAARQDVD
ncbi:MAG: hypothetical protein IT305_24140 [Chloroflexi bacterium]|nr:hypothetical protein [Chloroflexota bacterium]